MRTSIRLFGLAVLVVVAGCGGRVAQTPKDAFEAFKAAVVAQDFDHVYDMVTAGTRRQLDGYAKQTVLDAAKLDKPALDERAGQLGMTIEQMKTATGRTLFVSQCRRAIIADRGSWEKVARTRFHRAEVNGDFARVYVEVDGRDIPDDPMILLREEGAWKVDMTGE